MKVEIKHRFSGAVLFEAEVGSLKLALESAVSKGAYLEGANLEDADLEGADLRGANLEGADLKGVYLEDIKKDFFERLDKAKGEVQGLYDALIRGRVNGSVYEGECACFCGTIANLRKEPYKEMKIDLKPDSDSPTEKWFLAIKRGDTPERNVVVKITLDWMKEYMGANTIDVPKYKMVSNLEAPNLF